MKWTLAGLVIPLAALCGCSGDHAPAIDNTMNATTEVSPAAGDEVVASVRGQPITLKELEEPLISGYGLHDLVLLMQRHLARQELANQKLIITPQDIVKEKKITLVEFRHAIESMQDMGGATTQPDDEHEMTPAETEDMLRQYLNHEHATQAEFEIAMETNAILRKIAEPAVNKQLTEEAVRNEFNVEYGEKVQTQYIVCHNMNEIEDVRRDLAAGKSFADVARARSVDGETAPNGGELPPFTLQDNRVKLEIRQLAFSLKVGQVSDPLQLGQFYYIVKLVDRIPPKYAKYEEYRDSVRKDLFDQSVHAAMKALRQKLVQMALESVSIKDPVMQKQWDEIMAQKNGQVHDMKQIRKELDKEHGNSSSTTQPWPLLTTTRPAATTAPATTAPAAR